MEDLAHTIADLAEPSSPVGYRLLVYKNSDVMPIFEARCFKFSKGERGLCYVFKRTHSTGVENAVVSTAAALKYHLRSTMTEHVMSEPSIWIVHPSVKESTRGSGTCLTCHSHIRFPAWDYKESGTWQEVALQDAVLALATMKVPTTMKW